MDILSRLFQTAQGFFISVPLDNTLSYLYVLLDLLSKIFFAGFDPEGGIELPF